jgi:hypothetical protein
MPAKVIVKEVSGKKLLSLELFQKLESMRYLENLTIFLRKIMNLYFVKVKF